MIKMHPIYHEYGADEQGNIYSFKSGEAYKLKPHTSSKDGYCRVIIWRPEGQKSCTVHRFVAETFLGGADLQVNHKDCNKQNNSLSNLEFTSGTDNMRHAWANGRCEKTRERFRESGKTWGKIRGTQVKGENNPKAKITQEIANTIMKYKDCGLSVSYLARKFNVQRATVYGIWNGKVWNYA